MKKRRVLPQVEPVHLKPLFGIRPGIYLLVLYTIAILFIIFSICFLPGICKGGKYVDFSSPLSGAGLSIDGVYQGTCDYQYFVPSGHHHLTLTKADEVVGEKEIVVGHPLFLTWLFHRTQQESIELNKVNEEKKSAILQFDLQEIARYSAIKSYDNVTVYPPLYTNLLGDMQALGVKDDTLVAFAAQFIGSKEMYEEARNISCSDPLFTQALKAFESTSQSNWGERAENCDVKGARATLQFDSFTQSGISYSETTFVMGDRSDDMCDAGVTVTVQPFTIATTPVTRAQWALFMKAHPEWNKENVSIDGYLEGIYSMDGRAVTGIPVNAAEAFCKWLGEETGKEVFLPTEAQWSLAAMASRNKPSQKTLTYQDDGGDAPIGMLSTLWEITSTPYIPLARVTDYQKVQALAASYQIPCDRIVKGGLVKQTQADRNMVGTIRLDDASEQVGFRIAWRDTKHE